jgi:hypothetical protein
MSLQCLRPLAVAVVVSSFGLASAARAAVILEPSPASSISAFASANVDGSDNQTTPISSLPSNPVATASDRGLATSTVTGALDQAAFTFSLSQDNPGGFARTDGSGGINFSVDVDTPWAISGTFGTGPVPQVSGLVTGPFVELSASLSDTTSGIPVSLYSDDDLGASGDTLTLDPASGTLLAGHTYSLSFDANIVAQLDPTGTGNVTLAFGPTGPGGGGSPAPFPAAALAALTALPALVVARRRMR